MERDRGRGPARLSPFRVVLTLPIAAASAAPWRMSASLISTPSSPKARIDSSRMAAPATIVGARSGCSPVTSRRSASGSAASIAQHALAGARGRAGSRARARGRTDRAPGRSPPATVAVPATAIPCSIAARIAAGTSASTIRVRVRRRAPPPRPGAGGSACEVALGVADRAHARGDVEVRLARPAGRPRTRCCRRRCRPPASVPVLAARAVAPRKVRRASSSPEIVRASMSKRSRTWSR